MYFSIYSAVVCSLIGVCLHSHTLLQLHTVSEAHPPLHMSLGLFLSLQLVLKLLLQPLLGEIALTNGSLILQPPLSSCERHTHTHTDEQTHTQTQTQTQTHTQGLKDMERKIYLDTIYTDDTVPSD